MNNLLDRELEKICNKSKITGANIALYDNEKILYSYNYGYANKANNLKSTNDSLYMIGSNTKVMTALGIFILKTEYIYRVNPETYDEARLIISQYIDFYNNQRIQIRTKLTPSEKRSQFCCLKFYIIS